MCAILFACFLGYELMTAFAPYLNKKSPNRTCRWRRVGSKYAVVGSREYYGVQYAICWGMLGCA